MNRNFTIDFTSDIHGYYSAMDYASGKAASTGLAACAARFRKDGNSLTVDGGDNYEGSPFTYWLLRDPVAGTQVAAKIMNLAGYDFVTLGNHDFNFGKAPLEAYLKELKATCVSANVEGVAGVQKTAVVTLENGLRIGITGAVSHFVNQWEKPENLMGIQVNEAFSSLKEALEDLKAQKVDVTVCIYHGGFENDLTTGKLLSATTENQGYRICSELDFDILLTGHQHQGKADLCICGTYTCQTPDKARQFARMEVSTSDGDVTAHSALLSAGTEVHPGLAEFLAPLEQENAVFLDTPLGQLDVALQPESHLEMAAKGSLIANFFNQVQLEASGADLSVTCLGNEVKGFDRDVTIRDVVATYVYPNTLKTIRVTRTVLKAALERSAEYFELDESGALRVSEAFLSPIVMHYNFDHMAGLDVTMDLHRPVGDRVTAMLWQGRELTDEETLTLCLNNYRATGTGGYPLYADCELVKDQPTEIAQMIIEYIDHHRNITVDKHRWFHVMY